MTFLAVACTPTPPPKGDSPFGRECVDTLVKVMEDHREKFVVIMAGYPESMEEFLEVCVCTLSPTGARRGSYQCLQPWPCPMSIDPASGCPPPCGSPVQPSGLRALGPAVVPPFCTRHISLHWAQWATLQKQPCDS